MKEKKRLHIGIIGAGAAGLTTAWLLDNDCTISLFEKETYLGGTVRTIHVPVQGTTIPVEAGVEFFSNALFPDFNRLLSLLRVPVNNYRLGYTFYDTRSNDALILPPIHEGHISWHSLTPHAIFDFAQFDYFIESGHTLLATQNTALTVEEYAQTLALTDSFKNDFLYPFFAASWGCSPEDMKNYSAYDIVSWIIPHQAKSGAAQEWNEISGGMSTYIDALAGGLTNTKIYTATPVTAIDYSEGMYTIHTANSSATHIDHLIIATNEHEAAKLLATIPHRPAHQLSTILGTIAFYRTTIAIHGDRRLMPARESDWSIANILYDGKNSALTICKPHMKKIPLFRSWITYNLGLPEHHPLPEPLYNLTYFYHSKIDKTHFAMQKNIAPLQGNHNLWLAGFYTQNPDSHNSAIRSAMHVARHIAPESRRLALLTDKNLY